MSRVGRPEERPLRLTRCVAWRFGRAGWTAAEGEERGMAGKSDALKERYERFSQGDLEGALDLWSDDFVWEGSNASDLPGSGRHEGKQAAIQVLQQAVGAWDTFELTPDEFIEQD